MAQVHILCVCTANICRSPSAASLLRRGLQPILPEATISSAGIAAEDGRPACELSTALVGEYVARRYPGGPTDPILDSHTARLVTRPDLEGAGLVLALDRSHRAALAPLHPPSRARTLTLRQAATAAAAVAAIVRSGSLPDGAAPMPADRVGRFSWWVEELDAIRSFLPSQDPKGSKSLVVDPLDVPDPHAVGSQYHPMAVELIETAVDSMVSSLAVVLGSAGP